MIVFSVEVLAGCGNFAREECRENLLSIPSFEGVELVSDTELVLGFNDNFPPEDYGALLATLRGLRTVVSVYRLLEFAEISRPRELLETSRLMTLTHEFNLLRQSKPKLKPAFTSLRLSAAGSDSPELTRFMDEVSTRLSLPVDNEAGDALIRIRRGDLTAFTYGSGWQILLRITARPLATRAWRTESYPGAINASIAASVLRALSVSGSDRLLDLTCGTGTFLIEQLFAGGAATMVGIDLNAAALDIAQQHQRTARRKGRIYWLNADSQHISTKDFEAAGLDAQVRFNRLVMNPPWGELLGEHAQNDDLYMNLLKSAAFLSTEDARLGVLTHDIKRFQRLLKRQTSWKLVLEHRFFQKGHHPRLFLLERGI